MPLNNLTITILFFSVLQPKSINKENLILKNQKQTRSNLRKLVIHHFYFFFSPQQNPIKSQIQNHNHEIQTKFNQKQTTPESPGSLKNNAGRTT